MGKCSLCKNKVSPVERNNNSVHNHSAVNKLLGKLCQACQKKAVKKVGEKPTIKEINELHAWVNRLLTSVEVKRIRKKLCLTQKEAARICGGGPNAFSRYERGEITPMRATSNLLRLLSKYPQEVQYLLKFSY